MPYPSGISVLLRILTATVLTIFILYILISCEKQKRANGIVQNNEFCGLYVGYYEKRTSRSATKTKYIEIKKNNSIETFLINFQTTGLNHLIQDQEICLSYYHNLFSEKSTIHIKTKP